MYNVTVETLQRFISKKGLTEAVEFLDSHPITDESKKDLISKHVFVDGYLNLSLLSTFA